MLDQIAAAFERQDYHAASDLLKEALKRSPDDPWVKLYLGRLQEISGKTSAAEGIYRQLLRVPANAKLVSQARQGLERLGAVQRSSRSPTSAIATQSTAAQSSNQPLGFLVLEAIAAGDRPAALQNFSRVMQVDAYTARGVLPSRGWRLYRAAPTDEVQAWGNALTQAGISAFWSTLPALQAVRVFQVQYLQAIAPQVVAVCQSETGELGAVSFDWAEVAQRVEAVLPLFSPMVQVGYRDRLEWNEEIADYAHFCDLHLPQRNCILRIHDGKYNFQQSAIAHQPRETIRQRWNDLLSALNQHLEGVPVQSDFTSFAETAIDFATPISRLKPQMRLSRAEDHDLDFAFHLYSTLLLLKARGLPDQKKA